MRLDLTKGYASRLRSLQRLVSDADLSYPNALLFVPGLDGRNNKGSLMVLKYLFEGAAGKELLEGSLTDVFECLEEMVLLVQEGCVSVIYTREMRKVLLPWFENLATAASSVLVEYLSSAEDEASVDALQSRKCIDFKRMMLQQVPQGRGVGIPIPLGYDDVLDVETWPLLQAFALESVFCPTGFLSNRYTIVDMTEFLDVLYRTIDPPCVQVAVEAASSAASHMLQCVSILDTATAEQRSRKTAEDILGPLEMLFEFGELHCAEPADPALRPVVLLGADSQALGLPRAQLPRGWMNRTVGSSTHVVLEGCEPSTGLRLCRTVFLQRGRCLEFLRDYDALVDESILTGAGNENNNDEDYDDNDGGGAQEEQGLSVFRAVHKIDRLRNEPAAGAFSVSPDVSAVAARLDALYVKLWLSIRWAVRVAFSSFSDVLEAGTFLQQTMDALFKAGGGGRVTLPGGAGGAAVAQQGVLRFPVGLGLESVGLVGSERLQVHMDCLNALGKVVTIDDVDDMGGVCWAYVRVAVLGVVLDKADKSKTGSVAVGDTFLFSPACSALAPSASLLPSADKSLFTLGDAVCLTHAAPYYRCLVGPGVEEYSAKRLLASTRSVHMLAALGLGKHLDQPKVSLVLLTDHPLVPFGAASLRVFSSGLLVERLDTHCLPIMISIEAHVERMWTTDLQEVRTQALRLCSSSSAQTPPLAHALPEGFLVTFKLKSFTREALASEDAKRRREALEEGAREAEARRLAHLKTDADEDEENEDENEEQGGARWGRKGFKQPTAAADGSLSAMQMALQFNPLQRSLPDLLAKPDGPRHVSFVVQAGARGSAAMNAACAAWRDALRLHDLPEHKGRSHGDVPEPVLRAMLCYLDSLAYPGSGGGAEAEEEREALVELTSNPVGDGDGVCVAPAVAVQLAQGALSLAQSMTAPGPGPLSLQCVLALTGSGASGRAVRPASSSSSSSGSLGPELDSLLDMQRNGQQGQPGRQLVVLVGHAGSCVSVVGGLLAERLGRSILLRPSGEGLAAGPAAAAVPCLCLDLASATAVSDFSSASNALVGAWRRAAPAPLQGDVVVVSVVLPGKVHVPLPTLLSLLRALSGPGSSAAALVGVLSVQATEAGSSLGSTGAGPGLGREEWSARALEACFLGDALDLAVGVDASPSGQAFAKFRSWLNTANPGVVAARLVPGNLRLEEPHVELLLARLGRASAQAASPEESLMRSSGVLDRDATECAASLGKFSLAVDDAPSASVRTLQAFVVPPPASPTGATPAHARGTLWSARSLLSLLAHLFPRAPLSSSATESWLVPPNPKGAVGLRRAVELATVKVMAKRQRDYEQKAFDERLAAASTERQAVASGLLSVHGWVRVASLENGGVQRGVAVVEACKGHVLLRVLPSGLDDEQYPGLDELTVCGVVTSDEAGSLRRLFSLCGHVPLEQKRPVTRGDLTASQLLALQDEDPAVKLLPLPEGWYSDGDRFWGPHGVTNMGQDLRPDIEEIAAKHLSKVNAQIAKYNANLASLLDLI